MAKRSFAANGFTVDNDIGMQNPVLGKIGREGTMEHLLPIVIGDIRRDQTQTVEKADSIGIDDKYDPAIPKEQDGIRRLLADAMAVKQIAAKFIGIGWRCVIT